LARAGMVRSGCLCNRWFKKYGYNDIADALLKKLIDHSKGLCGDGSFRENYNPLYGRDLNVQNFSCSAAHMLMMLVK
jgi:putative isomerase